MGLLFNRNRHKVIGGTTPVPYTPAPNNLAWLSVQNTASALGITGNAIAVVLDQRGAVMAGLVPSYNSGTPATATINSSGIYTTVANGTTLITASYLALTPINTTITVQQVTASISGVTSPLNTDDASSGTFHPVAKDSNGVTITGKTFTFTSLNPSVITVNSSGNWAGQTAGNTIINIVCDTITFPVTCNVTHVSYTLVVIPNPVSLPIGGSQQLQVLENGIDVTSDPGTGYASDTISVLTIDPPTLTGASTPSTLTQGTGPITFTWPCTNPRTTQTLGGLPAGVTAGAATVVDSTHISFALTATGSATTGSASVYLADTTHGNSGTEPLSIVAGVFVTPVTSGLVLDMTMEVGTDTTTGGAGLGSWADRSSTGLIYQQATSGTKPIYQTASINGLPAVRLSTGKYMVADSVHTPLTTAPFTDIWVARINGGSGTNGVIEGNRDTTSDGFAFYDSGSSHADQAGFQAGSAFLGFGARDTNAHMFAATYEALSGPTHTYVYQDNVQVNSDSTVPTLNTTVPCTLGTDSASIGTLTIGTTIDVAAHFRWNRVLTGTELTTMHTAIAAHWGTP